MNPNAREFVPAHILQKRQEEANRLNELVKQLDQVGIDDHTRKELENGTSYDSVARTSGSGDLSSRGACSDRSSEKSPLSEEKNQNSTIDTKASSNTDMSGLQNAESNHRDRAQARNETDDDSYLLRAGENLCEFNGEQFIIPGDEEEEPPVATGYDFGNDEDNEDEDVCNAFEEFLENLPDH